MIATSANVLSNLIYLLGAVAVAGVGVLVLWWRHREPTSVDAKMASFQKGLSALAPDRSAVAPSRYVGAREFDGNFKVRPVVARVSHVHLEGAPDGGREDDRGGPDGNRVDLSATGDRADRGGYAGVVGDESTGPRG